MALTALVLVTAPGPALAVQALPAQAADRGCPPAEGHGEGQPQESESERQPGETGVSKPRAPSRRVRSGKRRERRDPSGARSSGAKAALEGGAPAAAPAAALFASRVVERVAQSAALRFGGRAEEREGWLGAQVEARLEASAPRLARLVRDAREILALPEISVDLMRRETAAADPFHARVLDRFYREATRPHPKLLLVPALRHGVAVCPLPPTFEEYLSLVEASARRNLRKAGRLGYEFGRVRIADHEDDVDAILRSAPVRQGKMPARLLSRPKRREVPPPPRTRLHDYPHYAVLQEGRVYAYAGCLVAGELCIIESLYGHAERQPDGIVPLLVVSIAREMYEKHPSVRYYAYGSYYGASDSMRRFKKKLAFRPHRVRFVLG